MRTLRIVVVTVVSLLVVQAVCIDTYLRGKAREYCGRPSQANCKECAWLTNNDDHWQLYAVRNGRISIFKRIQSEEPHVEQR